MRKHFKSHAYRPLTMRVASRIVPSLFSAGSALQTPGVALRVLLRCREDAAGQG